MAEYANYLLAAPSDAVSAVTFSPTNKDLLLSANWDSTVTLYNTDTKAVQASYPHLGAVLDVSFSGANDSGSKAYSGGLDKNIREIDISTSTQTILGSHQDAIRCVKWSDSANVLLTASWDKTLRLVDPRSSPNSHFLSTQLPSKAFSLDANDQTVIVAGAQRHVSIFDIRKLKSSFDKPSEERTTIEPISSRESSLKFMTRCIRINPAGDAFVSSSIEGRVAVDFFDLDQFVQVRKYAFKCHRAVIDEVDTVFPVNAVAFHPTQGTFATGGGDGGLSIWDLAAKKRLRQYAKYPCSVSSLAFNCDGTTLAVGGSVFLEEGSGDADGRQNGIWLRPDILEDCAPKAK